MRALFFTILGLVIIFGSIFLFSKQESIDKNQIKILKIGDKSLKLEIADTPKVRNRGLSGRKSLPDDTGMLFIFDQSGKYGFWMKNMNFAIDIVWIDEYFKVVDIDQEVTPDTFPEIFYPSGPIKYVLELPGGKSQNYAIDIGSQMYFE